MDNPQEEPEVISVESFTYEILLFREAALKFDIIVKFNGKTAKEIFGDVAKFCFNPGEFHASQNREKRERFYIFECGCGDPGCDGWFEGILVRPEGDKITWLIEEKIEKPTKLIFDTKQYKELDKKLEEEIKKLAKDHPKIRYARPGSTIDHVLSIYN